MSWACLEKLHSGVPKIPRKLCCDRLFQKTNKIVSLKCIKQCYLLSILCIWNWWSRDTTAGKAPKAWVLPRFYKKQPVIIIWGTILGLAWLKLVVAFLWRVTYFEQFQPRMICWKMTYESVKKHQLLRRRICVNSAIQSINSLQGTLSVLGIFVHSFSCHFTCQKLWN